jgi:hypothetical protein
MTRLRKTAGTTRARDARRFRASGRAWALGVVVALALAVSGCGGDDESGSPPQDEWAADVCGALSDWKSSMTTIATDFSGGVSRDVVSEKVDEAQSATEDLVDSLKSIGPPETESGDQAKAEIDQFADTASASIDSIQETADSLTDGGLSGFTEGIAEIASELNAIVQAAQTALTDVEQLDPSGELRTAIQDDSTCQGLTGGS